MNDMKDVKDVEKVYAHLLVAYPREHAWRWVYQARVRAHRYLTFSAEALLKGNVALSNDWNKSARRAARTAHFGDWVFRTLPGAVLLAFIFAVWTGTMILGEGL